jgi:hypothetical protein
VAGGCEGGTIEGGVVEAGKASTTSVPLTNDSR